jgi:hypothetical protein
MNLASIVVDQLLQEAGSHPRLIEVLVPDVRAGNITTVPRLGRPLLKSAYVITINHGSKNDVLRVLEPYPYVIFDSKADHHASKFASHHETKHATILTQLQGGKQLYGIDWSDNHDTDPTGDWSTFLVAATPDEFEDIKYQLNAADRRGFTRTVALRWD